MVWMHLQTDVQIRRQGNKEAGRATDRKEYMLTARKENKRAQADKQGDREKAQHNLRKMCRKQIATYVRLWWVRPSG